MFKCKIPPILEGEITLGNLIRKIGSGVRTLVDVDKPVLKARKVALVAMIGDGKEVLVVTSDRDYEFLNSPTDTRHKIWFAIPKFKVCDIAYEYNKKLTLKNFKEGW